MANLGSIRIALVGLGYWGPNLLRVLSDMEEIEVRWLCDLDEARLDRYARRHPGPRTTTHYEQILDDPETDAVVIATPVFTHFALAADALRVGKHVFVEKPLAPRYDLANELIAAAAASNRVLMCGHTFLFSPPVRAIRQLVDDGTIGDIYFVSSSRVNLGLHQRDVSVIWDLAPHDFSILLYWLQEMPETIRAVGRASIVKDIPDVAFVTMTFPSGIVTNTELSWLAPSKLRRTAIVGSKKMVVYDDTSSEPIRVFDHGVVYHDPETFGEYQLSYRTGDILSPKVDSAEPLALEMREFARAIRERDPVPHHAELARNVVRLIEHAETSLNDGGAPIDLASADVPT